MTKKMYMKIHKSNFIGISGTSLYKCIVENMDDLRDIGINESSRWILNQGIGTSIMACANRVDTGLVEISKNAFQQVIREPNKKIFEVINTKENINDEIIRKSYQQSRVFMLDVFCMFTLLRTLLDEFVQYILKPKLSVKGHKLNDSFSRLLKNKNKNTSLYRIHSDYFDKIEPFHSYLIKKIRTPRDSLVHYSAQIELKLEDTFWYYALVAKGDITNRPKGRVWNKFSDLNEVFRELTKFIDSSVKYLKKGI